MAKALERIGIVGATSLLGKELSEELAESPLAAAEIVLLEQDVVEGQLSAAGEEISFVQALSEVSFRGLDLVFFAGTAEQTREHWQTARRSGAMVVDLTHAIGGEPGVLLRAPAVSEAMAEASLPGSAQPGLETAAVVVAHPLAAAFAMLAARLQPELRMLAATVLLPASEHERAGLDELHQQTVNLLSFSELPRVQFDAQSAFNLLPTLGQEAQASLSLQQAQIAADYHALGEPVLPSLLLQIVQAPVFHGYAASVLLDFRGPQTLAAVAERLRGRSVEVVAEGEEPPSNLSAAGRRELMIRVSAAPSDAAQPEHLWLWLAADNLKLRAANAIDCAMELRRLRPLGKVQ